MNLKDQVLERAKRYMDHKDYRLDRLRDSKVMKPKVQEEVKEEFVEYGIGDKVRLLEQEDSAVIYKGRDAFNNVTVFYQGKYMEVHCKRVMLELRASELYPEGYDLNTIFVSYQERKFQHDMERGSKKALRQVQKELRKNRNRSDM
jgi:hypothetical protein